MGLATKILDLGGEQQARVAPVTVFPTELKDNRASVEILDPG